MANETTIRVVIADDHPIIREGLRLILSTDCAFEVVGTAGDGEEALELARRLVPDILLLDVDMPRMTGLEALRSLSENQSTVKIVVLKASIENKQIVEALQLGARGVIRKETLARVLLKCIHSVFEGQYWLGQNAFSDLVRGLQSLAPLARKKPGSGLLRRNYR